MVTFVQTTYALATFVHITNISAVTGPILTKLFGLHFLGGMIFVDLIVLGLQFFFNPKFIWPQKFFGPMIFFRPQIFSDLTWRLPLDMRDKAFPSFKIKSC